jgi:hypothetical protein
MEGCIVLRCGVGLQFGWGPPGRTRMPCRCPQGQGVIKRVPLDYPWHRMELNWGPSAAHACPCMCQQHRTLITFVNHIWRPHTHALRAPAEQQQGSSCCCGGGSSSSGGGGSSSGSRRVTLVSEMAMAFLSTRPASRFTIPPMNWCGAQKMSTLAPSTASCRGAKGRQAVAALAMAAAADDDAGCWHILRALCRGQRHTRQWQ